MELRKSEGNKRHDQHPETPESGTKVRMYPHNKAVWGGGGGINLVGEQTHAEYTTYGEQVEL
jgi:hypothetical protein